MGERETLIEMYRKENRKLLVMGAKCRRIQKNNAELLAALKFYGNPFSPLENVAGERARAAIAKVRGDTG